jgi:hypothetical protein
MVQSKFPNQLPMLLGEGDREEDLPVNLIDRQVEALAKVRQALVGNGWVVEVKDEEEAQYQVAVGKDAVKFTHRLPTVEGYFKNFCD